MTKGDFMSREVILNIPMPETQYTSSWITRGAGLLFTSHAPMHPDGTMSTDNIENQLILMFTNLQKTLEAAESSNDNVLQIIIYLTDPEYSKALNEIYPQFFAPPLS